MIVRNVRESDYNAIIAVVDEWWGGREMTGLLPRLFFHHFNDTSFVIEDEGKIAAFIIGFVSQAHPSQAYVHFTGVHPGYRKKGLGLRLYQSFFEKVKQKGCDTVHLITSPVNKDSIAFHIQIGFQIEDGDKTEDGISVHTNYDGQGGDRVVFSISL